jgi:hypothetical protein
MMDQTQDFNPVTLCLQNCLLINFEDYEGIKKRNVDFGIKP